MASVNLPLTVVYETPGATSIRDLIVALQAADTLIHDGIALLPTFVPGVDIQGSAVNVRTLTQESPLRELFLVALIVAFQDDLESEIPPMVENLFNIEVPDSYDTLLTIVVLTILFYGVAFAKDAAARFASDGPARAQLDKVIRELAEKTGKTEVEVRAILDAKYSKPAPVKALVKAAKNFFRPSHMQSNSAVVVDRERIEPQVVADVPFADDADADEDFERFQPLYDVELEIHAQDRDKQSTGWAAVIRGVTEARLRMKLIAPLEPHDIWNKDVVRGDVTLISRMTAEGFAPSEIHLTAINRKEMP